MSSKGRPSAQRHKLPTWVISVNGQTTNLLCRSTNAVDALGDAIAEIVRQGGADLAASTQLAVGVSRASFIGEHPPVVQAVPEAE